MCVNESPNVMHVVHRDEHSTKQYMRSGPEQPLAPELATSLVASSCQPGIHVKQRGDMKGAAASARTSEYMTERLHFNRTWGFPPMAWWAVRGIIPSSHGSARKARSVPFGKARQYQHNLPRERWRTTAALLPSLHLSSHPLSEKDRYP